ncbi:MAG TPA: DUF1501 domain-containing protein [Pirellulales bacterium]|nr:DUF1501 domain-containing protein [Pirellulales bacterium]
MLRILASGTRACDGVTRRELMRIGALSLFSGISLPRLLEASQRAPGGRRGRANSVILLNLFGGPSHLDMFDLKPAAPAEIRGEFKPIASSLPGQEICEHLPKTAQWMHRTTLIRTVSHGYNSHNPYNVLTGFTGGNDRDNYFAKRTDHPSMGSVCQYLGIVPKDVPGYVVMPAHPGFSQGLRRAGPYGGYLGSQYDPLITLCAPTFEKKGAFYDPVQPAGDPLLPALDAQPEMTLARLDGRHSLLDQIDRRLAALAESPDVVGMGDFKRQAMSLLVSSKTRDAFDVSQEAVATRDRYGRSLYGSSLLVARRLVEAGTTFVAVNWECAAETHGGHWDMHENNFGMLRGHLPVLDQITTALLDDLDQRGLLGSTLVIVTGEMGRAPKVNAKAGRDHWPQCGFALLAGGGVKEGLVYGSTDKHAAYPLDRPVSSGDLVATIYELLGIDPNLHVNDLGGRPIHVAHGGAAIREIIA